MRSPPDFDWDQVRSDFAPDGSLRDIYVLDTTLHEWRKVLELLLARGARLSRGDRPIALPEDLEILFAASDERARLSFDVGPIDLCCHFFMPEEIELDFVSNAIGADELRALLSLMIDLGDATLRRVRLTPENMIATPIFEYDPEDGQLRCHAACPP